MFLFKNGEEVRKFIGGRTEKLALPLDILFYFFEIAGSVVSFCSPWMSVFKLLAFLLQFPNS